ncbi:hypothetical protein BC936DRAFT_141189, partial [Jimgerdemannia flammicorona]
MVFVFSERNRGALESAEAPADGGRGAHATRAGRRRANPGKDGRAGGGEGRAGEGEGSDREEEGGSRWEGGERFMFCCWSMICQSGLDQSNPSYPQPPQSRADDLDRQLHRMMEQQQQDKDRRWAEIDALNARAKNLNNEADEAEQEMEEVCRVRERVMKVETEMDEREKKVIDARVANDESDLTIKQLTKKVLQGQQALADIERDIATNEKQIPMLEEQKRLAVASREFKMAGQCSNRLKQLGATLEERRASLVSRTPVVEEDKRKLEEAQDEAKSQAGRLKEVEGRPDCIRGHVKSNFATILPGLEIYHTLDTLSAELRSSLRSATERGRKTLEALLQHELEGVRRRMEHVRVRYALADVPSANGGESDLLREVDELQQGDDDRPISQVGGKEREQARKEWVEDLEMKLRVAVNKEDYDTA